MAKNGKTVIERGRTTEFSAFGIRRPAARVPTNKRKEKNMFFKKPEQKKGHPLCALAVGMLTVVGACSLLSASKQKMTDAMCAVKSCFCKCKKDGQNSNMPVGNNDNTQNG